MLTFRFENLKIHNDEYIFSYKYLKMMNAFTTQLDNILTVEKFSGDNYGLGFKGEEPKISEIMFVRPAIANDIPPIEVKVS